MGCHFTSHPTLPVRHPELKRPVRLLPEARNPTLLQGHRPGTWSLASRSTAVKKLLGVAGLVVQALELLSLTSVSGRRTLQQFAGGSSARGDLWSLAVPLHRADRRLPGRRVRGHPGVRAEGDADPDEVGECGCFCRAGLQQPQGGDLTGQGASPGRGFLPYCQANAERAANYSCRRVQRPSTADLAADRDRDRSPLGIGRGRGQLLASATRRPSSRGSRSADLFRS